MGNKNRVYNEKIAIEEKEAKNFWNKRAQKYDEDNPYVSIKLGDNNPERAQKWDDYEKNNILPLLEINLTDTVLDIGCGIGRLSDAIIPKCKYYLGVDYAEELIALAKKRTYTPSPSHQSSYTFMPLSIQEISTRSIPLPDEKFTVVIIAGVLSFINDVAIKECIANVLSVAANSCRIYIADAVGISRRLTLNNFFSEELGAQYSIIYRTEEEYANLVNPALFENGFKVEHDGEIIADTANNNETKRMFKIYHKR